MTLQNYKLNDFSLTESGAADFTTCPPLLCIQQHMIFKAVLRIVQF